MALAKIYTHTSYLPLLKDLKYRRIFRGILLFPLGEYRAVRGINFLNVRLESTASSCISLDVWVLKGLLECLFILSLTLRNTGLRMSSLLGLLEKEIISKRPKSSFSFRSFRIAGFGFVLNLFKGLLWIVNLLAA